jgi:hypothetical protein
MSGTLWQDTGKLTGVSRTNSDLETARRFCWNDRYDGHAGWLEIHPVDSVRWVDPGLRFSGDPPRRKDVAMRSRCGAMESHLDDWIEPATPPPGPNSMLRFQTLVDPRFSMAGIPHSETVEASCPDRLHVTAQLKPLDTFKAVYLMWWEEGSQPRGACQVATPAPAPPMSPSRADCLDECTDALAECVTRHGAQCGLLDKTCRAKCR